MPDILQYLFDINGFGLLLDIKRDVIIYIYIYKQLKFKVISKKKRYIVYYIISNFPYRKCL